MFIGNLLPRGINYFMRLAMLVNVLLTRVSLHTGLRFRAYINGTGQVTGLFFFSSTKETFFPTLFPFPQYVASFKDLLVEAGLPSPLLEIN